MNITHEQAFKQLKEVKTSTLKTEQKLAGLRYLTGAVQAVENGKEDLALTKLNSFYNKENKLSEENNEIVKEITEEVEKAIIEEYGDKGKDNINEMQVKVVE